jgi:hypothetical protein
MAECKQNVHRLLTTMMPSLSISPECSCFNFGAEPEHFPKPPLTSSFNSTRADAFPKNVRDKISYRWRDRVFSMLSTFQNGQRLISNCPGFKHKLDRKLREGLMTSKSFHMVAVSAKVRVVCRCTR